MPTRGWRVSEYVMDLQDGDDTVLLDAREGRYVGLNRTGGLIWELLKAGRSLEEMATELSATTGVDATVATEDIAKCIAELDTRGLVTPK